MANTEAEPSGDKPRSMRTIVL